MSESRKMECQKCGGILTADDNNKEILTCPFCGSKEILIYNDAVEIQRIKSETEKEIVKAQMEKEEKKEAKEEERSKKKENAEKEKNYKKSKLCIATIVLDIICLICVIAGFSNGHYLSAIIALLQVAGFSCSWLMGMQIIPEKRHNLHALLFGIGIALIIPFAAFADNTDSIDIDETYDWPETELSSKFPKPSTGKITFVSDDTDSIRAIIENISQSEYSAYVKECEAMGYTVEKEKDSKSYKAFNDEGYKVEVDYLSDYMTIDLYAPIEMGDFRWPSGELAEMLPKPESDIDKIKTERSDCLYVYVGNFDIDKFNAYVDECIEAGFDVDYSRGDDYFIAENEDGYSLNVRYEGIEIISISLSEPYESDKDSSDIEDDDSTDSTTKKSEEKTTQKTSDTSYKEFWDSYEDFFDDYIEFMESYDSSSPTMYIKYGELMVQYADVMQKAEDRKDEDMSDEEAAYALEVETRVSQKLLAANLS